MITLKDVANLWRTFTPYEQRYGRWRLSTQTVKDLARQAGWTFDEVDEGRLVLIGRPVDIDNRIPHLAYSVPLDDTA